jgi:dynein heavy chain
LALLQYELYADCMPTDDVPQMAAEQLQRVLQSALNSKKLRDQLLDASSLVAAANMQHARALNKVALDALVARGEAGEGAQLLPLPAVVPQGSGSMTVLASSSKRPRLNGYATVEVPAGYDFVEQFSEFSFRSLLTKLEVISALGKIKAECAKVGS